MSSSRRPRIVAHRGYSAKAPENTIVAMRKALDAGADGVEWDMYTASCGTPILFHDSRLGRTTNGVGPVGRRTWGQLKTLDAGGWFSKDFEGEPIPSLKEACEAIKDDVGFIVAEIKGWREMEDVDRMVGVIEQAGLLSRTLFISMDWTTLDRVRTAAPEAAISFIVEARERLKDAILRALSVEGAGLALDYRILLEDASARLLVKEAELPLGVWTVKDLTEADALLALGVSDFTTNNVAELVAWREALSQ